MQNTIATGGPVSVVARPECAETAREQQDPEIKREYSDLAAMWRLIAMNSEETESV